MDLLAKRTDKVKLLDQIRDQLKEFERAEQQVMGQISLLNELIGEEQAEVVEANSSVPVAKG